MTQFGIIDILAEDFDNLSYTYNMADYSGAISIAENMISLLNNTDICHYQLANSYNSNNGLSKADLILNRISQLIRDHQSYQLKCELDKFVWNVTYYLLHD